MSAEFEKTFPRDAMSKRERVEATLAGGPVDRAPILEQLSYNPRVIGRLIGRNIEGFDYGRDEICEAIRLSLDMAMPPSPPRGSRRYTDQDGFEFQADEWTEWRVSRPFKDEEGACDWLRAKTQRILDAPFDRDRTRAEYRESMRDLQARIGGTVILDFSFTGFCDVFDAMGLEIFTFFQMRYPEVLAAHLEASVAREVERIHAAADAALTPVVLIPEDFATKQGPLFSPDFLRSFHFPYVRRVAEAWREHDVTPLYHSDGNYRSAIPDLLNAGVAGFYCLEPSCGMDIVELHRDWPDRVWAGGVDGVDLMERGAPDDVRREVLRQIDGTDALGEGGVFIASSSEINPPIPPENFLAMVRAADERRNARI